MSLRSVISESVNRIFLRSANEFAEEVMYYPYGSDTGFSCKVVTGTSAQTFIGDPGDVLDRQTMQAFASLPDLMAGILRVHAQDRKPRRQDYLEFPSSSDTAGIWVITEVVPDGYAGVTLELKFERINAVGGEGKQRVDP